MGSMSANNARLKYIPEFASRDLTENTEIGSTWLDSLIDGLQRTLQREKSHRRSSASLQTDLPDFMEVQPVLIERHLAFIEKAPEEATRDAAEVFRCFLKNITVMANKVRTPTKQQGE